MAIATGPWAAEPLESRVRLAGIPKTVLIADEDAAARERLAGVLRTAGFDVLCAASGNEALQLARATVPSAVVLEIPLGDLSGYEVCRAVKAELGPDVPVIFASGCRTETYDRVAGLLVGADDYLVKPYAPDELLARLRNLMTRSEARYTHSGVTVRLTPREHEVLRLLSDGLRQQEIGRRLFISPKTVSTHVESILRKLGASSSAEAVAIAYRRRILSPPLPGSPY